MKSNLTAAVLCVVLGVSSPLLSYADQVTTPVDHSGPGFDADAGICWAFALTGLMEGEALKRGLKVSLSAEYLGFYNLYSEIKAALPEYKELSAVDHGLLRALVERTVKRVLDPSVGSNEAIGLTELTQFGIVPDTVFQYTFFEVPEGSPTLADRILTFAETKLIDPTTNARYMSDSNALIEDLGVVYGKAVPKPTDTFTYGGKKYTAQSFLSSYLAFNPNDYIVVQSNAQSAQRDLQVVQMALKDNISVPIGFQVINDQETIENTGMFSTDSCPNGNCTANIGGHEVLAVSSLVNSSGNVDALIVKNDWGTIGLDDLGEPSSDISQLGYFQLTRDYLQESPAPFGWNYTVPKRYVGQ